MSCAVIIISDATNKKCMMTIKTHPLSTWSPKQ